MTDTKRRSGLRFILRQPFAVLGAVGLLGLGHELVAWQEPLQSWLHVFQQITRSTWDLLLGWLFQWSGTEQPVWLKDYLTMGAIVFGLNLGAKLAKNEDEGLDHSLMFIFLLIQCFLFWPLLVLYGMLITLTILLSGSGESNDRLHARLYGEMVLWSLIIIAVNAVLPGAGS